MRYEKYKQNCELLKDLLGEITFSTGDIITIKNGLENKTTLNIKSLNNLRIYLDISCESVNYIYHCIWYKKTNMLEVVNSQSLIDASIIKVYEYEGTHKTGINFDNERLLNSELNKILIKTNEGNRK